MNHSAVISSTFLFGANSGNYATMAYNALSGLLFMVLAPISQGCALR